MKEFEHSIQNTLGSGKTAFSAMPAMSIIILLECHYEDLDHRNQY